MNGAFPRVETEFTYRGIDAAFLENEYLRLLVIPGKGGDVLEFRDKRADVDVFWHADHDWQAPSEFAIPTLDPETWHDYYPGGWQVNLPLAGYTDTGIDTAPYGLHGESGLLPFDVCTSTGNDEAVLRLTADLVRYPFTVERELRLPAGEPTLHIDETVTNTGEVELEYIWQHHLAIGAPLLGPAARVDIPAATGVTEDYPDAHPINRLAPDETFAWPEAPGLDGGTVDLRQVPGPESTIHDVAYATDLEAGWYAVTNPELDLGFGLTFPTDPFECVWYWQPLGGATGYPYYGRNYNIGLEPTTAYPSTGVPEVQQSNATIDVLGPGDSVSASLSAVTYQGQSSVSEIRSDGTVLGQR